MEGKRQHLGWVGRHNSGCLHDYHLLCYVSSSDAINEILKIQTIMWLPEISLSTSFLVCLVRGYSSSHSHALCLFMGRSHWENHYPQGPLDLVLNDSLVAGDKIRPVRCSSLHKMPLWPYGPVPDIFQNSTQTLLPRAAMAPHGSTHRVQNLPSPLLVALTVGASISTHTTTCGMCLFDLISSTCLMVVSVL